MIPQTHSVSVISPAEADEIIRRMKGGPDNKMARNTLVLPGGWEISGEYSLTAKDAKSGEIEWQHDQKNLITDFGRRCWMETRWFQASINFCPSIEAPVSSRYSLPTDTTQHVGSGNLSPSVAVPTHTKTFSTVFGVPGVNRTLGMIALCGFSFTGVLANIGVNAIMSFALLTPPKVQTTTQTLEVVYKVSMNPIA